MSNEQGDDRVTGFSGEPPARIPKPASRDQNISPSTNTGWNCEDEETFEREPGHFIITSKLGITAFFIVAGALLGMVFVVFGVPRGIIIPTHFVIRLHLEGAGGAILEKTIEALVEGVLLGSAVTPVLALERREPLGKPHVTLRGYPRRLLRMLLPMPLAGALIFVLTEWLNELTLWATGGVFTVKEKMLLMSAVGATMGAVVGLFLLRFPSLVRFLPFRKRFPLQ